MFQIRMAPPSPFTKEEEKRVILEFGAVRNINMVKRSFRIHFKKTPKLLFTMLMFLTAPNSRITHFSSSLVIGEGGATLI